MENEVVLLTWFDLKNPHNSSRSTGFVGQRKDLYCLSTAHQLDGIFPNLANITPKDVGVKVLFSDRKTEKEGIVVCFDRVKDLTCVQVALDETTMNNSPFSSIQGVLPSEDPIYAKQLIYTIHNPAMIEESTGRGFQALFQYSEGFLMGPKQPTSEVVHYHIPLIMPGSSGAPVFDLHSNKLVCMVKGSDDGCWPIGGGATHEVERLTAIPLSTIIEFIRNTT